MKNINLTNSLLSAFLVFSAFCCNLNAKKLTNIEREKIIKNLCNDWKGYLGDMNFSDKFLFQRILYLKPPSLEKFEKFKNVKLGKWIIISHELWLRKHFKGKLLKKLLKLKPSKYYLRKNKYDESLLFYQTEMDESKIMLLENFTVSLITFKPNDFNLATGVKRAYLENILYKWIKIDTDIIPELLKKPIYHKGMIFANNQKRTHILSLKGWRDDIICFLTEKGISLLLFKATKERALMGIPTEPGWLDKDKGLFDETK